MNQITNRTQAAAMLLAVCLCAGPNRLQAQSVFEPYTFTTVAGLAGTPGSADGTGSAARFCGPYGVATDTSGHVYVADATNHTIRQITAAGVVSTLAGLPGTRGSDDGTGSAARFNLPSGVATDASGNVYVADTYNHAIRKISPAGVVSTLAGLAGTPGSADGTGSTARFYLPTGMATDASSNVYIADNWNDTIRKITPAGVVTTLGGVPGEGGAADGVGPLALFQNPAGVAVDAGSTLYVADWQNSRILRGVPPSGPSGVGYVNVAVSKGWSLIANPLNTADNTVSSVLKPPEGSKLYAFSTNGWSVNSYTFGAWEEPSQVLAPGEGVFLHSPAAVTLVFSGQVPQGTLTNHLAAGLSLKASILPQGGRLDTVLGFPVAEGDIVYRYVESQGYIIYSYLFGEWDLVPVLQPGEAFFVMKLKPADWVREFHLSR